jgi:uncharacterized protein YaiE (UPF0345 family)
MSVVPKKFENVSVDVKANIYFDGKVVSHSLYDRDGRKTTLGLIYPGSYKFNTGAAERMTITSGACKVLLASGALMQHETGSVFVIPANSSFTITVENGICEYICEFI